MKILFVVPYLPSLVRVRPYHFIRELSTRHALTILATDTPDVLVGADELRRVACRVELVPMRWTVGLRRCVTGALHGDPFQAAVCHSPELDGRMRAILRDDEFDVVHVEHLRAARLLELIPPGLPTLYDAVDCISLLQARTLRASHSVRQRVVAAIELRRTRAYEARLLRRVDQAIVTSPDDQRALHALVPSAPVTVVPNGVDLEYFEPVAGQREPTTLVFSGKMSYHANVTAILHFVKHIFPLVRAVRPDVRLCVVGSNPPESVRALARDSAVTVTGHVADVRAHLGRAAVAVCPVTVKVGIQNKVLEAMAMGVPVVASREGAEGLSAVAGRDLVVADGPTSFANEVCRLLDDPMLAGRVGECGRRYVENHHQWSAIVHKLEELYIAAANARPHVHTGSLP